MSSSALTFETCTLFRRSAGPLEREAVEWNEVKEEQVRSGNQEETETESEDGDENADEIQSDNEGD